MDRLAPVDELPFRVGFTGHSGHLRVEPLPPVERLTPLRNLPDLVLPPAFESETPETIVKNVEKEYLTPDLDHDEFRPDKCGRQWDFDWFHNAAVHLEPSLPRLTIVPVWEAPYRRACNRAKMKDNNKEEQQILSQNANNNNSSNWIPKSLQIEVRDTERSQDSSSVLRRPGPPEDFVRGNTNSRPFLPGGFEDSHTSEKYFPQGALNGDWIREIIEGGHVQTIPPGFKHGLDLGVPKAFSLSRINTEENPQNADKFFSSNKMDGLSVPIDDLFKKAWEENVPDEESDEETSLEAESMEAEHIEPVDRGPGDMDAGIHNIAQDEATDLDEILLSPQEDIMQEVKKEKDSQKKKGWAVMVGDEDIAGRFSELVPDMALDFPFELDKFQKEAIYHIERGDSVFVAAHTSAGKTVVAEYAFALAAKHCTRAVYTSPIKTISNQKYRDFSEKFDVGLLTGDVSLRPEASCLIMTTEILRSMLYKGADIIRDIEWVIFDEVHYVNDVERGVVWEEVIIMLPRHINIVLLSATVPNRLEFADWIGRTKKKKIYVTGTTRRPVPLEHYLYYSGELHKICEKEMFLPQGVKAAKDAYNMKKSGPGKPAGTTNRTGVPSVRPGEKGGGSRTQKFAVSQMGGNYGGGQQRMNAAGSKSETTQLNSLVNKLSKKGWLPAVVFCFSKNRCDQSADSMTSVDLTSGNEKSEIRVFCDKAFSRLKGSDRQLPQVLKLQELLRRGIGVHHAGLLPIVKEVVEMLFCRGVIKVLFSTETFAMGVNAPAKTVAFHAVRKFDGKSFRQLLPGEYTQMAGRAGRRGLDEVGIVILICWEEIPEESDLKCLITGNPTKLESQFRLTYSMILNLLRVEDLKVEDMLKRSFAEFHAQQALHEQQTRLQMEEGELKKMSSSNDCIRGSPTIEEYYTMAKEAEKLGDLIHEEMMQSRAAQQALTPGRLLVVRTQLSPLISLGVVLKSQSPGKSPIVLVLIEDPAFSVPEKEAAKNKSEIKGPSKLSEGYYRKGDRDREDDYSVFGGFSRKGSGVVNVSLPHYGKAAGIGYVVTEIDIKGIISICKNKIRVDNVRLLEDVNAAAYSKTVQELLQHGKQRPIQYPPALDPVKDLKLNGLNIIEAYQKRESYLQKMAQNQCHGCPKLQENYTMIRNQHILQEKVNYLKFQLSDAALQQMPDFQQRIQVLREVGCVDLDLVVQLKGRVACEINSGDELVATEMLFENQLDELEPAEAVAIMSALIFQQKDTSKPYLTPKLLMAKERLLNTALRLGDIQALYGLPIDAESYARDSLKFGLVEVVYEWAKGTPFADICQLTDVPEGSIVRTIVRLDETCREFKNAARIMGNSALFEKMEVASDAIKRDIVFAASLYVTGVPS